MRSGGFGKLGGEIEVGEIFIGDAARNMHLDKREKEISGTHGKDKTDISSHYGDCESWLLDCIVAELRPRRLPTTL